MGTFQRIVGIAALAATGLVASDALATIGPWGTVTEIIGASYYMGFTVKENGASVSYANGVQPCTAVGALRLSASSEALLIEAFKNDWRVKVEYTTAPGNIKCVLGIYVQKPIAELHPPPSVLH